MGVPAGHTRRYTSPASAEDAVSPRTASFLFVRDRPLAMLRSVTQVVTVSLANCWQRFDKFCQNLEVRAIERGEPDGDEPVGVAVLVPAIDSSFSLNTA